MALPAASRTSAVQPSGTVSLTFAAVRRVICSVYFVVWPFAETEISASIPAAVWTLPVPETV